jgi:hypothetical protein
VVPLFAEERPRPAPNPETSLEASLSNRSEEMHRASAQVIEDEAAVERGPLRNYPLGGSSALIAP